MKSPRLLQRMVSCNVLVLLRQNSQLINIDKEVQHGRDQQPKDVSGSDLAEVPNDHFDLADMENPAVNKEVSCL